MRSGTNPIIVEGSTLYIKSPGTLSICMALGQEVSRHVVVGPVTLTLPAGVYYVRFTDRVGWVWAKRLLVTGAE